MDLLALILDPEFIKQYNREQRYRITLADLDCAACGYRMASNGRRKECLNDECKAYRVRKVARRKPTKETKPTKGR